MSRGTLYIVATPIGNLDDITRRAEETLRKVDIIAAEDTRHTMKLLNSLGIKNTLFSFHEHSGRERAEALVELLEEGKNVALVSDAGTPIISDPGAPLTELAAQRGIEIVPIPGPCAAISALTVGAISAEKFIFEGFLPKDKGQRRRELERIAENPFTSVLYESPHQLKKTLADLAALIPERRAAICKEMTKIYESICRGTVAELEQAFAQGDVKGEYVIVLEGAGQKSAEASDEEILEQVARLLEQGMSGKNAVKAAAEMLNVNKNRVYQLYLEQKEN